MKRCFDCVYCSTYYTKPVDVCDRTQNEVILTKEEVNEHTECEYFLETNDNGIAIE